MDRIEGGRTTELGRGRSKYAESSDERGTSMGHGSPGKAALREDGQARRRTRLRALTTKNIRGTLTEV